MDMPDVFNLSNLTFLVGVVLCLMTSLILWRYSDAHNKHNRLLSLYFFMCSFGNFMTFLVYSGLIQYSPWYHLFRVGNIFGMTIMPISFLYFRSVIKQEGVKATDLLHLLPSVLYAIDYLPVFLLPASEKIAMVAAETAMPDRGQSIMHGWITPTINWIILRTMLWTIYWLLEVRMLYNTTRVTGARTLFKENAFVFGWLILICSTQVLYFLPFYINIIFGPIPYNFVATYTFISLGVFLQIAFLLFRPGILYGLKGLIISHAVTDIEQSDSANNNTGQIEQPTVVLPDAVSDTMKGNIPKSFEYLPEDKMEEISRAIEKVLVEDRAFLKKGYSMRDLSVATGYQLHLLSPVINQAYKQHFNDLINSQRIQYAAGLIQSGAANILTLQALAEQCGFNSRNTFTIAFKKHTGKTPSEYTRKYNSQEP